MMLAFCHQPSEELRDEFKPLPKLQNKSVKLIDSITISLGFSGLKGDVGLPGEPGSAGQLVEIKGARGQKGEPGLTGLTGLQGEKGDRGAPGFDGLKGERGAPGLYLSLKLKLIKFKLSFVHLFIERCKRDCNIIVFFV